MKQTTPFRLGLLSIVIGSLCRPAGAQPLDPPDLSEPPASQPEPAPSVPLVRPTTRPAINPAVRQLVNELGSPRLDLRDNAEATLRRVGLKAIAALEEGIASSDPEIRVRAKALLPDIKLGLEPGWPADMVLLMRHYNRLPPAERVPSLKRVADGLGPKAAAFLANCAVESASAESAEAIARLMAMSDAAVYDKVIDRVTAPTSQPQARLLGWALMRANRPMDAMSIYLSFGLGELIRGEMLTTAVQKLRNDLAAREFEMVARDGEALIAAVPSENRLAYLTAEALVALGRDEDARRLRQRAATSAPDDRPGHGLAAEMLTELGRWTLAAAEWRALLSADRPDLYTSTALERLAAIHESCGLFAAAGDLLGRRLELGLAEPLAGELRKRIAALKARAAETPAGATLHDRLDDDAIAVVVSMSIKGFRNLQLRSDLDGSAAVLTVTSQPDRVGLFDARDAGVTWNAARGELTASVAGQAVGPRVTIALHRERELICVCHRDVIYFFELNTKTGACRLASRYEKDYKVRLEPGRRIAGCRDVKLKLAGRPCEWSAALRNVDLDVLPAALDVVCDGVSPTGAAVHRTWSLRCVEPDIRELVGGARGR